MTRIASLLAFTLALGCAGGPTGVEPSARAAGPCYGVLIEDTLFVDTHRPLVPSSARLPRPTQQRRGVRWRRRVLPSVVDTIILQAWVQVCLP